MPRDTSKVIFDLDGTITKADTFIPYLALCITVFGIRKWPFFLLPFYAVFHKMGIIPNTDLKEKFLGAVLGGMHVDTLAPVTHRFVRSLVRTGLNPAIIDLVKNYAQNGHSLILASASLDFYVESIGAEMLFDAVVCTKAQVRNHLLTGRIDGKNCHGDEKRRRVEELIGPAAIRDAIVYSDHYSDLPLMETAKTCYLVNPRRKTRSYLIRHGFGLVEVDSGMPIKLMRMVS